MMETSLILPSPLFAHQYGWDEIALFLVPIVLAVAGVRFAEKRAAERKQREAAEDEDPISPEAEQPTP
jgi:hypothetical protein